MSEKSKGIVKKMYFYPDKKDSVTRVTVGGVLVGNNIQIGISKQRPGEMFNKHIGRGWAIGRAISNPLIVEEVGVNKEETLVNQFLRLAKQIINK